MEDQQKLKELMLEIIDRNEQMQLSSVEEVLQELIEYLQVAE